ncbi:CDR ABC transporter [Phytophthora cactorum]|nr:CDR ABC transporter [Phytophthora cactorum]
MDSDKTRDGSDDARYKRRAKPLLDGSSARPSPREHLLPVRRCELASGCQVMSGTPPTLADGTTVEEYMDSLFWIKRSEIWTNCGYVVAWIVFLRLLALLALRYVNHTKR